MINNLRSLRQLNNLTQSELARSVYVSKNTISSIELGTFSPTLKLALKIAFVLHCDVNDIFALEEFEKPF